jgi:branched-chain amino acid transport system substrate-binding protein
MNHRRLPGILRTLALACCSAVVAGLLPAQAADKGTFRIGLLNPVTGPFAALGADVNAGFQYYLTTHGGTLGGFAVDVRSGDEANSTDAALSKAHQFIEQDKVNLIVGLVNSGVAYGISDYVDQQKTPLLITVAGADGLTQAKANPSVFRLSYTSSQDAMPLGAYACTKLGKKTAVIVGLDYAFGWEAAGGFARTYTGAGCKVVQEIYAPLGTQDWSPFVQRIDRNAAVVFAVIAGPDAIRFLAAARDYGLTQPIVGHGALTDEQILQAEGATASGIISSLHYAATLPNRKNDAFRLGYEGSTHKSVSQYVEDGYAAAQVVDAALAKLPPGDVQASAFTAALRTVRIDAPRGPLHFDAKQQAVYNVYIRRVRQVGGKYRNEVIDSYSDVSQFWRYDPNAYLQLPPYTKLKGTWAKP